MARDVTIDIRTIAQLDDLDKLINKLGEVQRAMGSFGGGKTKRGQDAIQKELNETQKELDQTKKKANEAGKAYADMGKKGSTGTQKIKNDAQAVSGSLSVLGKQIGNAFSTRALVRGIENTSKAFASTNMQARSMSREVSRAIPQMNKLVNTMKGQSIVDPKMLAQVQRDLPAAYRSASAAQRKFDADVQKGAQQAQEYDRQLNKLRQSIDAQRQARDKFKPDSDEFKDANLGLEEMVRNEQRLIKVINDHAAARKKLWSDRTALLASKRSLDEIGRSMESFVKSSRLSQSAFTKAGNSVSSFGSKVATAMGDAEARLRAVQRQTDLQAEADRELIRAEEALAVAMKKGSAAAGEQSIAQARVTTALSSAKAARSGAVQQTEALTRATQRLQHIQQAGLALQSRIKEGGDAGYIDNAQTKYEELGRSLDQVEGKLKEFGIASTQIDNNIRASNNTIEQAIQLRARMASTFQQMKMAAQSNNAPWAALTKTINQFVQTIGRVGMAGGNALGGVARTVGNFSRTAQSGFASLQRALQGTAAGFLNLGNSATRGLGEGSRAMQAFMNSGFTLLASGALVGQAGRRILGGVGNTFTDYFDYEKALTRTAISAGVYTEDQAKASGAPMGVNSDIVQDLVFGLQRGEYKVGDEFQRINLPMEEIAQGLYYYTSAIGQALGPENMDQVGSVVSQIMAMASATQTSLETATKGVLNAGMEFGYDPRDPKQAQIFGDIAGMFGYLANISTMEVPDIAETFKMMGPMAHILSGTNDGDGLIEAMVMTFLASEVGLRGGGPGRGIAQGLSSLLQPTGPMLESFAAAWNLEGATEEELPDLFKAQFFDGEQLKGGLFGFLEQLANAPAIQDNPQAAARIVSELFTQNASRAVIGMMQGYLNDPSKLKSLADELRSGAPGQFLQAALQATNDTLAMSWQGVKNAFDQIKVGLIDSVAQPLKAAFIELSTIMFSFARALNENPGFARFIGMAVTLVGVLATVGGALLVMSGTLLLVARAFSMVGTLAHPFIMLFTALPRLLLFISPMLLLIAAAAIAMKAAWDSNFAGIKTSLTELRDGFDFSTDILPKLYSIADALYVVGRAFTEFISILTLGSTDATHLGYVLEKVFGTQVGGFMLQNIGAASVALAGLRMNMLRFFTGMVAGTGQMDNITLAFQGFIQKVLLGGTTGAQDKAVVDLGKFLGIDNFIGYFRIAALEVREFVQGVASAAARLNAELRQSFGDIGLLFDSTFSIDSFRDFMNFLSNVGIGIADGWGMVVGQVVNGIEYILEAIADLMDTGSQIGDFARQVTGLGDSVEATGRLIGVVIGSVLGVRLVAGLIPGLGAITNMTLGLARLAVQFTFAAVQAALYAAQMIVVGAATLIAQGGLVGFAVLLGALALGFVAFIGITQGWGAAMNAMVELLDGVFQGFTLVIGGALMLGSFLSTMFSGVAGLLEPLLSGLFNVRSEFELLGIVVGAFAGVALLRVAGILPIIVMIGKSMGGWKLGVLGVGVALIALADNFGPIGDFIDNMNEKTNGWLGTVMSLVAGFALIPGSGGFLKDTIKNIVKYGGPLGRALAPVAAPLALAGGAIAAPWIALHAAENAYGADDAWKDTIQTANVGTQAAGQHFVNTGEDEFAVWQAANPGGTTEQYIASLNAPGALDSQRVTDYAHAINQYRQTYALPANWHEDIPEDIRYPVMGQVAVNQGINAAAPLPSDSGYDAYYGIGAGNIAAPVQGAVDDLTLENRETAEGWYNTVSGMFGLDGFKWDKYADMIGLNLDTMSWDSGKFQEMLSGTLLGQGDPFLDYVTKSMREWEKARSDYQEFQGLIKALDGDVALAEKIWEGTTVGNKWGKAWARGRGPVPTDPGGALSFLSDSAQSAEAKAAGEAQRAADAQKKLWDDTTAGFTLPTMQNYLNMGANKNAAGQNVGLAMIREADAISSALQESWQAMYPEGTDLEMPNVEDLLWNSNLLGGTLEGGKNVGQAVMNDQFLQDYLTGMGFDPQIVADAMPNFLADPAVEDAVKGAMMTSLDAGTRQALSAGGVDWRELAQYAASNIGKEWDLSHFIMETMGVDQNVANDMVTAMGLNNHDIWSGTFSDIEGVVTDGFGGIIGVTEDLLTSLPKIKEGPLGKMLEVTEAEFAAMPDIVKAAMDAAGVQIVIGTNQWEGIALPEIQQFVDNFEREWGNMKPEFNFDQIMKEELSANGDWMKIWDAEGDYIVIPAADYAAWKEGQEEIARIARETGNAKEEGDNKLKEPVVIPPPIRPRGVGPTDLDGGGLGTAPSQFGTDGVNQGGLNRTMRDIFGFEPTSDWSEFTTEVPVEVTPIVEWVEPPESIPIPEGIIPPPTEPVTVDVPVIWNPVPFGAGGHRESPSRTNTGGKARNEPPAPPAWTPPQVGGNTVVGQPTNYNDFSMGGFRGEGATSGASAPITITTILKLEGAEDYESTARRLYDNMKQFPTSIYTFMGLTNFESYEEISRRLYDNMQQFPTSIYTYLGITNWESYIEVSTLLYDNMLKFPTSIYTYVGITNWESYQEVGTLLYDNIIRLQTSLYTYTGIVNWESYQEVGNLLYDNIIRLNTSVYTYVGIINWESYQEVANLLYNAIARLNTSFTTTVNVVTAYSQTGTPTPQSSGVRTAGIPFTPYASGGLVRSKYQLVGEDGPELVSLPYGTYVHDTNETIDMMNNSHLEVAAASSEGGGNLTINIDNITITQEADIDKLIERLDRLTGRKIENHLRRGAGSFFDARS